MIRHPQRGFSLVEVLVALIITSVGLLGIAKLQAVSYASTGTSSVRSLAAIEGSSMIAAIRANRSYWSAAPVPLRVAVTTAGTVTSTDGILANAGYVCDFGAGTNAPCAPNVLAARDLHKWASSLHTLLPDSTAGITCSTPPGPPASPVTCTVTVEWKEHTVGVDAASSGNQNYVATVAGGGRTNFTLYVVP